MVDRDQTRSELIEAWRKAPDVAIARGIANPSDYTPDALEVLQAEGLRRGVEVGTIRLPSPYEDSVYLRLLAAVGRFLRPAGVFLWHHRFISAILVGIANQQVKEAIAPILQPYARTTAAAITINLLCIVLYAVPIGVLCLPLRAYRTVFSTTAFAVVGGFGAGLPHISRWLPTLSRQFHKPYLVFLIIFSLLIAWGMLCLVLSLVVFLHNRFRPLIPLGHCTKCGYNLHGLPEPRCPECGKPFELRD